MPHDQPITVRDLYPNMGEGDLAAAEASLGRYVAVVTRIHERLRAEGKPWPRAGGQAADPPADLTLPGGDASVPDGGEIPREDTS